MYTEAQPEHTYYRLFIFTAFEAAQSMGWILTMDCGSAKENIQFFKSLSINDYIS